LLETVDVLGHEEEGESYSRQVLFGIFEGQLVNECFVGISFCQKSFVY